MILKMLLERLNIQLDIQARLLFLCLCVATPLLVLGSYIIWQDHHTLNNEARQATQFEAAIAVRTMERFLNDQKDTLSALASLPQIKNLDKSQAQLLLQSARDTESCWQAVYLVNPQGEFLAKTSSASNAGTATKVLPPTKQLPTAKALPANKAQAPSNTLREQTFFQEILRRGKTNISGYSQCPLLNTSAILVGAPVYHDKQVVAVLIASINPKTVLTLFRGLGENNGSVITVCDLQNRVMARTLNNDFWLGKDFSNARTVRASRKHWRGTLEVIGIADPTPRAYAFDRVPGTGWLVVVGVPTKLIYGPIEHWFDMVSFLAFVAITLAVVLAYIATKHFTGPINDLVREACAIGRGDLSKRVKVSAGGEIGLLGKAFNQMAANLQMQHEHTLMVEKIAESIRQSLDLDQILNTTVSELGSALGASRCCLALVGQEQDLDLDSGRFSFDYLWWDTNADGTPLKNRVIRVTKESLLQTILAQGSILSLDVLHDKESEPLFEHNESSPEDWASIKSLMACPISMGNKPLGLILIHQCDTHRTWSEEEQELVQAVAGHVALAMEQANLYGKTKSLAEQELLINHIVRAMRGSLDLDVILASVTKELGEALAVDRCQIIQPRPEGPLFVSHEYHGTNLEPMTGLNIYMNKLDFNPQGAADSSTSAIFGLSQKETADDKETQGGGNPAPLVVISNCREDKNAEPLRDFLSLLDTKSLICAPLYEDNRLLGILMVHQSQYARNWKESERNLIAALADQIAITISHRQLFAQVKQQAITDGMTGLYNHIYLKNRLAQEIRRAERKDLPCSLLMIDLDLLKQINDRFGHPIGDTAIRQVAWTLKNVLRSGDTAARYGGEEFAVILPETPLAEAALIAERLCRKVNEQSIPNVGSISISIGAATFPEQAASADELVEKADKALYLAKRSGRNQICIWSDDEKEPGHLPGQVAESTSQTV
jgi:diguanylate cyclase (GGDEF)-like protein